MSAAPRPCKLGGVLAPGGSWWPDSRGVYACQPEVVLGDFRGCLQPGPLLNQALSAFMRFSHTGVQAPELEPWGAHQFVPADGASARGSHQVLLAFLVMAALGCIRS